MKKILVLMDPIETINPKKDTSLALMLEAQKNGMQVYYALSKDLLVINGQAKAKVKKINLFADDQLWFEIVEEKELCLSDFSSIWMRVDPPFDMEYIYATYILDMAKAQGVQVINDPQSLRDCNEKMFIQWFPQAIAPTLVTKNKQALLDFVNEYKKTIIKPMDGMGGEGIHVVDLSSSDFQKIIEQSTKNYTQTVMLQEYLPQISEGDKRILVVHGEVIPYVLARIPQKGSFKGNLAAGGKGVAQAISQKNLEVCQSIAQELKKRGLLFVGIDMIGDYVTEINITSPTCLKEIEAAYPQAKIAETFIQGLKK